MGLRVLMSGLGTSSILEGIQNLSVEYCSIPLYSRLLGKTVVTTDKLLNYTASPH